MIKGLFRFFAFLLIAAGFVAAIMDGARSLANSSLDYARISGTITRLIGERLGVLQVAIERHVHPVLWDPVLVTVLMLPTSVTLLLTGLLFYRIGKRNGAAIGHITRN